MAFIFVPCLLGFAFGILGYWRAFILAFLLVVGIIEIQFAFKAAASFERTYQIERSDDGSGIALGFLQAQSRMAYGAAIAGFMVGSVGFGVWRRFGPARKN